MFLSVSERVCVYACIHYKCGHKDIGTVCVHVWVCLGVYVHIYVVHTLLSHTLIYICYNRDN